MKTLLFLLTLTLGLSATPLMAAEQQAGENEPDEKKNPQTHCPVMGGKINPKLYADVKGHRVYVCCKGCLPALKKDPDTYIDKLKKQDIDVEKIQTHCPVMGGKINKDLYVDANGKRIYLCCKGCASAVKADPDAYIEKLEKQGITVESLKNIDAENEKN